MARKKKCKVFVSYSRHDEELVRGLVGFMKLGTDEMVFLDVTSLEPGDEWKERIEKAIQEALIFVVCWCCQSRNSEFVAREIELALAGGNKRLVPVLFCSTPLPLALADRQWQDLRGRVVHDCRNHEIVTRTEGDGFTGLLGAVVLRGGSTRTTATNPAPRRVLTVLGAVTAWFLGTHYGPIEGWPFNRSADRLSDTARAYFDNLGKA